MLIIYNELKFCILAPNAAPSNFRNISKTSTTITFQWDALELTQSNNEITLYVITCSDLEEGNVFTVSWDILLYVGLGLTLVLARPLYN